ncbi:tumor necrosis factor ligand superfamily member 14 [Toxotes jaculatrix]|uniref:tumor necrosis factor ligand superfamily member 14 n=1 Tax=Toxotes jaculatrix TaxID=941984 RepID=UPI001B3A8596|nr:tumor necrosis factor ligand superfamily member 14 [Toxotes jaculatrix]
MASDKYPSVYVVDSHADWPHPPPKLRQRQCRMGVAQTLLFMLVSVALCGMIIEACLIYHLYQLDTAPSASFSKHTGGEDDTSPTKKPSYEIPPSKPVAHLTDGQDVIHEEKIMAWSMNADPLLYEMDYKDRKLIIQKEGYYYVYSKVFFTDNGVFHHSVNMHTEKYAGGRITLLQSRKYSLKSSKIRSNSYLGGVFHLYKNDAVYVEVSNTTKIDRHKSFENIFGAYMI